MASKVFEVGDVLPATTQLRLTFDFIFIDTDEESSFTTTSNYINGEASLYGSEDVSVTVNSNNVTCVSSIGSVYIYDLDTSTLTETQRTVTSVDNSHWTWEDVAPQGFSVIYEENGGTNVTDLTEQTNLPSPLPTTTKAGYTFVAWYIDSALTTRAVAGATIEEDTTLYAKWHTLGSLFTEIADAIRSKDGTSESIRDVDFGERVNALYIAIELTQAQYDALTTPDANTYYIVMEEE